MNTKEHWESIYKTKQPNEVSWTEQKPSVSLEFINKLKIPKRYIDYPELLFINSWLPNDLFKQVTNIGSIRAIIPKPLRLLAKKIKNLKA